MTKSHTKHTTKHTKERKNKKNNSQNWQIATIVLAILLVAAIFTGGFNYKNNDINSKKIGNALVQSGVITQDKLTDTINAIDNLNENTKEKTKTTTTSSTVDKKLPVELYVMSHCPYGVQAENTMFAAIKDLGENNFDLKVDYIATAKGDGTFDSLHGPTEADGDKVQLCINKYDPDKFLDMVLCMNKDVNSIPGNWETCATELGINKEPIKTCFEGDEGTNLLTQSTINSQNAKASGSPTIYVNKASYTGGRGVNDFKRAFCNGFNGEKPSACADIPEPTKLNVIVLNDERCPECQQAQTSLVGQLKSLFPGMQVKTIDYMTDEGKKLFADTNVKVLPAMLFSDDATNAENYDKIKQYLVPAGNYKSLLIGASFDPTAEICDNNKDDTGNGKVDCADSTCANSLSCREEKADNLQVFIMSDCPYGKKAIEALKPVKDNFKDNMDYEVHYIASDNGDGTFNSLHGSYEAEEDKVQLCVKKYSPAVWFDYLYCRSVEGIKGHDWNKCAKETGVDIASVNTCATGDEGANLLREDIKIAQGLGIGASPTWMTNNKYQFSGIDSETVKTNFCQYNQGTAGCENTLSSDSGSVPAGSCG